jgi:hypothetical protein
MAHAGLWRISHDYELWPKVYEFRFCENGGLLAPSGVAF